VIIRRVSDDALLLKITGSGGDLTGQIGGSAGNFETSNPPNLLTFASDFINFADAVSLSRSISFTSVTRAFSIARDGLLSDFTAAGTGTFAADYTKNSVPESGNLALMGVGFFGFAVARHRAVLLRRRR